VGSSAAVHIDELEFGAELVAVPPQRTELTGGSLELALYAGGPCACYTAFEAHWVAFQGCAGALVGAYRAAARGYAVNRTHHPLWLAGSLALEARGPLPFIQSSHSMRVTWTVQGNAWLPSRSRVFDVTGIGSVYRAARVAVGVQLAAGIEWR
jgi:hypothetical protein